MLSLWDACPLMCSDWPYPWSSPNGKSGPISGESLRFESGLASKESFSLKERYSHLQEMPRQWLFLHYLV